MTPSATPKSDAPPSDPIRAALDDPRVRADLARHAGAVIGTRRRGLAVSAWEVLAEDAVQETIERALRGHASFDAEKGSVSAWLHGILINVLRNQGRALAMQPIRQPTDGHAWEALAAALPTHIDAVDAQIDAALYLSRLSDEHRAILHMRYWQDLSSEEIASQLGISAGNARVRLSRALGAARQVAGSIREEDGR